MARANRLASLCLGNKCSGHIRWLERADCQAHWGVKRGIVRSRTDFIERLLSLEADVHTCESHTLFVTGNDIIVTLSRRHISDSSSFILSLTETMLRLLDVL